MRPNKRQMMWFENWEDNLIYDAVKYLNLLELIKAENDLTRVNELKNMEYFITKKKAQSDYINNDSHKYTVVDIMELKCYSFNGISDAHQFCLDLQTKYYESGINPHISPRTFEVRWQ